MRRMTCLDHPPSDGSHGGQRQVHFIDNHFGKHQPQKLTFGYFSNKLLDGGVLSVVIQIGWAIPPGMSVHG